MLQNRNRRSCHRRRIFLANYAIRLLWVNDARLKTRDLTIRFLIGKLGFRAPSVRDGGIHQKRAVDLRSASRCLCYCWSPLAASSSRGRMPISSALHRPVRNHRVLPPRAPVSSYFLQNFNDFIRSSTSIASLDIGFHPDFAALATPGGQEVFSNPGKITSPVESRLVSGCFLLALACTSNFCYGIPIRSCSPTPNRMQSKPLKRPIGSEAKRFEIPRSQCSRRASTRFILRSFPEIT